MRSILIGAALVLLVAGVALGASSGGSKQDDGKDQAAKAYERGHELLKEGDYEKALESFRNAYRADKKNAEYLNMVAYTQRKTGDLAGAFEIYARVLKLEPDFPQAREYLAEAHLQAALEQLAILRGYGSDGEKEAAQLVAALQEAAKAATSEGAGEEIPVPDEKPW